MELINLLDLKPHKVSSNIEDYSLMLTAPSGIGKTELLANLYGDKALFLTFENSHKGIAGINAVTIDSFETLMYYLQQLENPQVRERFSVVVIDTLFLLDYLVEKSICDSYGKEILGDCLKYNKAYKIVDKKFLTVLKRLQAMEYTMSYVCHPAEKKVKMMDANGKEVEVVTYEPKVSDRVKALLIPEVDIRLYATTMPNGERIIFTQKSAIFDARCRVANLPPSLSFDAEVLRKAFENGIKNKLSDKEIVDNFETKNIAKTSRTLKEVMDEIQELSKVFIEKGISNEGIAIINKELGNDDEGNQRTLANANDNMIPALETIIIKLKNLL